MTIFASKLTRLEDYWVSPEIRNNPTEAGKARLLFRICLFSGPPLLAILLIVLFTLPQSRPETLAIMTGQAIVTSTGLLLRWSKSIKVPGTLFMTLGAVQLLGATILTGNIVSPVIYSFPVLVIVASILVEFRVAIYVTALLLIGSLAIWLPFYEEYQSFTHHAPLHIRTLTLAWSMGTAFAILSLFQLESRRSDASLREMLEERDRFVAYLSHELRNPLTAILGATELLSIDCEAPNQVELIDSLHRSAEGMTQVLNDVLDLSKADVGMLQLERAPVLVGPVCQGVLAEFRPFAQTKGIDLGLKSDLKEDCSTFTDPRRLQQVLRNLLSNALKFTDKGGFVSLSVTMTRSEQILFEIKDSGIGIDQLSLSTILEPFRQVESNTRSGTGLGLPISCLLLDLMDSQLKIDSSPGEGSCFRFALPIASLDPEVTALRQEDAPESPSSLCVQELSVLLADDNESSREILSRMVTRLGARIETAADGLEVLELIEVSQPEVFLLDIQMPQLDGLETAQELRKRMADGRLRKAALIAVTGNLTTERQFRQDDLFDDILAKPVRLTELEACLARVAANN
jgi:signal transduction histidine kinase/ActR/RegA family two-component response regulator